MKTMFLKEKRARGYNCLVFDVRDGKTFGYSSGNAIRHSENVETLAAQLDIPTRYLGWYNYNTGSIFSYIPVLNVPSEVRVLLLTALVNMR